MRQHLLTQCAMCAGQHGIVDRRRMQTGQERRAVDLAVEMGVGVVAGGEPAGQSDRRRERRKRQERSLGRPGIADLRVWLDRPLPKFRRSGFGVKAESNSVPLALQHRGLAQIHASGDAVCGHLQRQHAAVRRQKAQGAGRACFLQGEDGLIVMGDQGRPDHGAKRYLSCPIQPPDLRQHARPGIGGLMPALVGSGDDARQLLELQARSIRIAIAADDADQRGLIVLVVFRRDVKGDLLARCDGIGAGIAKELKHRGPRSAECRAAC